MELLTHPDEVWAMVRYKLRGVVEVTATDPDIEWCYRMLDATSRSFAAVIKELGDELRDPIMVFYLALRALDTVEDDMRVPIETRAALLESFYERLDGGEEVRVFGSGDAEEKELVENLDRLARVYQGLKPKYQEVIQDITRRMGAGMREFALRDVVTLDDWNLYCHYVAGLVGIGLTKMFGRSELEDAEYENKEDIANAMGLFLQKTNIIRDYLEDLLDDRVFWPREVWSLYATELGDLREEKNSKQALSCLNHLITNAITLIPDCLDFMEGLRDPNVFNFVCIPQVMAIATLALCYDNIEVFKGVVKIRKGEAVKLVLGVTTMQAVYTYFDYYCRVIAAKIRDDDPNAEKLRTALRIVLARTEPHVPDPTAITAVDVAAIAAFVASGAFIGVRGAQALNHARL